MSEYCLCQRIKPVSDPKTPFSSEDSPSAFIINGLDSCALWRVLRFEADKPSDFQFKVLGKVSCFAVHRRLTTLQHSSPITRPGLLHPPALEPVFVLGLRLAKQVMLAAVKCKQNVDPALADTLAGAVAEMSKMYLK